MPGNPRCSDDEFITLFQRYGATETAVRLHMNERAVYLRRRRLEKTTGTILTAPGNIVIPHPGRVDISIQNGTILVGSDFHIWPGELSTCARAFKKFVSDIKPDIIVLNGDVMDFPRISRHPQNWESAPDPQQEIEAAQDYLADLVQAGKRNCRRLWTLGNHDARLEAFYANSAPQMRGMKGVHLSDFFSEWDKAMSCMVNRDLDGGATMIKHRFKSGPSAPRANTLNAGVHMVTGHLHSQKVIPVSDYRGDRYGVDTGCIADKEHKAFAYCEDSPLDWRSGFAVLTYRNGRLLYPELITKWSDDRVQFRGELIKC